MSTLIPGFRVRRVYGKIAVAVINLAILTTFYFLFVPTIAAIQGFSDSDLLTLLSSSRDLFAAVILAILAYFFVPGFIGSVISIPGALLWRKPMRIMLLRKFHRDDNSKILRQAINHYVSPFGHVYTLSDRDIKTRWYVRLPLMFAQLVFLHFRPRTVKTPQQVEKLRSAIGLRWVRNINWIVAWNKVFPVRCSDEIWQDCVEAIGSLSDVIVIDISALSDNIIWEIERCRTNNMVGKLILLTTESASQQSKIFLRERNLGEVPLVSYESDEKLRLPELIQSFAPDGGSANVGDVTQAAKSEKERFGFASLKAFLGMYSPFAWFPVALAAVIALALLVSSITAEFLTIQLDKQQYQREIAENAVLLRDAGTRELGFANLKLLHDSYDLDSDGDENLNIHSKVANLYIHQLFEEDDVVFYIERTTKHDIYQQILYPSFEEIWEEGPASQSQILNFLVSIDLPVSGRSFWLDSLTARNLTDQSKNFSLAVDAVDKHHFPEAKTRLVTLLNDPAVRSAVSDDAVELKQRIFSIANYPINPNHEEALLQVVMNARENGAYIYIHRDYAEYVIPLISKYWDSISDSHTAVLGAIHAAAISDAVPVWEKALARPDKPEYEQHLEIVIDSVREFHVLSANELIVRLLSENTALTAPTEKQLQSLSNLIELVVQLRIRSAATPLSSIVLSETGIYSTTLRELAAKSIDQLLNSNFAWAGKPVTQVGTMGHVNAGKTTLTAAISRNFGRTIRNSELAKFEAATYEESASVAHVEYNSERHLFYHVDNPGHPDFVKNMIIGAIALDVGIVVVDATKGPQSETLEQIRLASRAGVKHMVGYVNKTDLVDDLDLMELVEIELQELLEGFGYEDVPIIRGSALQAFEDPLNSARQNSIRRLVSAMDDVASRNDIETDGNTIFLIKTLFQMQDETGVIGIVNQGQISSDGEYVVIRQASETSIKFKSCTALKPGLPEVAFPDNLAICVVDDVTTQITADDWLITSPNAIGWHSRFEAETHFLSKEDGGHNTPFSSGYTLHYYFGRGIPGVTYLPTGTDMVMPGDSLTATVSLSFAAPLYEGMRFDIQEGGRTVGAGIVIRTFD